jgi:formylglycine-generating enzyme required for sulfatase activity
VNTDSKSATVIVNPAEPTISIKSGETATVEQKKTIQFEADVLIPQGQPEQTPTWTVEGDCGTIDEQTGLFTAAATPGTCVVKASIVNVKGDAITYRADVTVTGPEEVAGMAYVTAGTFQMGCVPVSNGMADDSFCDSNSQPQHEVTLTKDFYIGKKEVSQAEWKATMGEENNPSTVKGDNLPVTNVSWVNAHEFIDKLNERDAGTGKEWRLPTDAEWEYAARGGAATKNCEGGCRYSGSNAQPPNDVAWFMENSEAPHPVGTLAANELGLYDMSGNVAELVEDFWDAYPAEPQIDPIGPDSNRYNRRVRRNGSYYHGMEGVTVVARGFQVATTGADYTGFRLALTLTEPDASATTVKPTFFESASETVSGLWDSITK